MKTKKVKSQKSSRKITKGKTRNYQYLLNARSKLGPGYVFVSHRVIQAIIKSQKE
jgi:hypothetical protein